MLQKTNKIVYFKIIKFKNSLNCNKKTTIKKLLFLKIYFTILSIFLYPMIATTQERISPGKNIKNKLYNKKLIEYTFPLRAYCKNTKYNIPIM